VKCVVLCVLFSSPPRDTTAAKKLAKQHRGTPHAWPVILLSSKASFLVVPSIYLNRLCNISNPRTFPSLYSLSFTLFLRLSQSIRFEQAMEGSYQQILAKIVHSMYKLQKTSNIVFILKSKK
jgi:hypothetical protein